MSLPDLLRRDPVWSAYALADLDPPNSAHARWWTGRDSVVLLYQEFATPILFALGDRAELRDMLELLDAPRLLLQLQPEMLACLPDRYRLVSEQRMWRMSLGESPAAASSAVRVGPEDLAEVEALYRDGAASGESPALFAPSMLTSGVFFGIRNGGRLVSVAGTHVVEPRQSTASIGNVYTHREHRGRGYASAVTVSVARELRDKGCGVVVLNVAQRNAGAIRIYEALGFTRHCEFVEGVAEVRE